ncbi:MAG: NADH-quinone oxidoreductase subunit J [Proteobacteria bacterium]|nr:NADH-quinone oxidoreductase subunit J [Pseudomonadota bacterium]
MNFAEIVFVLIMFITFIGALMAVLSGSIIYAMIGLVTAMFGIAGLYVYLNAPFLAMMQILIYVGAISILIVFAIMLAGPLYKRPKEWTTLTNFFVSLIVSLFSFFVLLKIIMRAFLTGGRIDAFAISTKDIGRALFDKLTLPFELISLLIVVSIIGAIMLALFSKEEK